MSHPPDPIVLREHTDSEPVQLSVEERDALAALASGITVRPAPESRDHYVVNPGNVVGAIQLNALRFELRPKLPIRQLLFLISYSVDPTVWRFGEFGFEEEADLFEVVVHAFTSQLERALRLGSHQGYRYEAQPLQTIRGRIRFDDHIRSRFGLVPPIECSFDEFTADIEINRLLRAAVERLGEIRLRSPTSRQRLRLLASYFDNVSRVRYDPRAIPEIKFDRRTERFRGPVELARLILRSRSTGTRSGEVRSAAFLLDMARIFENFVVVALREQLGADGRHLVQGARGRSLHLDARRALKLRPDLSWWEGPACGFVGDVKYKRTKPVGRIQNPDVYQLLAYTIAARTPGGLLIYAAGVDDAGEQALGVSHQITEAKKVIVVRALDLSLSHREVLEQVEDLAAEVRRQAARPPGEVPRKRAAVAA